MSQLIKLGTDLSNSSWNIHRSPCSTRRNGAISGMYSSWYSLSSRPLQNSNFFQRNSAHFTLSFMCRTDRKKNPSWEARRSAFDQPIIASIKRLFAFCINKFCNLVQYLRKSLEFPINLLGSFCSTGLQGVTDLLSKLIVSKPHEGF